MTEGNVLVIGGYNDGGGITPATITSGDFSSSVNLNYATRNNLSYYYDITPGTYTISTFQAGQVLYVYELSGVDTSRAAISTSDVFANPISLTTVDSGSFIIATAGSDTTNTNFSLPSGSPLTDFQATPSDTVTGGSAATAILQTTSPGTFDVSFDSDIAAFGGHAAFAFSPVPEPSGVILLSAGLLTFAMRRKR